MTEKGVDDSIREYLTEFGTDIRIPDYYHFIQETIMYGKYKNTNRKSEVISMSISRNRPPKHPLKDEIKRRSITLWELREALGREPSEFVLSRTLNGIDPMPPELEDRIKEVLNIYNNFPTPMDPYKIVTPEGTCTWDDVVRVNRDMEHPLTDQQMRDLKMAFYGSRGGSSGMSREDQMRAMSRYENRIEHESPLRTSAPAKRRFKPTLMSRIIKWLIKHDIVRRVENAERETADGVHRG